MGDLDPILVRLSRVARTGRPLCLLFDYDGTLAPIMPAVVLQGAGCPM